MSRHHILPPIVYTPAPPKPKKTERRPKTAGLQKSGVAASDEAGETEETSEVFVAGATARAGVHAPSDPFTPVESAEHKIPSTTGKLSESTLKELLLAQEQDQPTAAVTGAPKAER
jgi:hypothetical protein